MLQASVKALRAAQFSRDSDHTFQSLEDVRLLTAGQITVAIQYIPVPGNALL